MKLLLSLALPLVAGQSCIDPATFTFMNFDQYTRTQPSIANNNLGGVGPAAGPPQLAIANTGIAKTPGNLATEGRSLGVRFTVAGDNSQTIAGLTEPFYRSANNIVNGFGQTGGGRFGVVNLRSPGPICNGCTGAGPLWHPDLTFTDLNMDIIDQTTNAVLDLTGATSFRTFLTFYDFDAQGQFGGANLNPAQSFAIECLQAEPVLGPIGGTLIERTSSDPSIVASLQVPTLLVQHPATDLNTWVATDGSYTGAAAALAPTGFAGRPIHCASTNPATGFGTSANNPVEPLNLTDEQKARSLTLEILNTAQIRLRYILRNGNAVTGRNFLFGGKPPLPFCVPVVPPQNDPHFQNAHGDYFDFKGKHQTTYNLLSHQSTSVNAFFEHVDYVEAGKKHRTVHGSYMKAAYVHYVTPTGKHVLLEYSGKSSKALSIGVVDAADATAPPQAVMSRVRLTEGYTRTFEEVFDVTYIANKSLSVVTPEWTINIDAHVKPGILGASTCADGKCYINVRITPGFNADKATVAPHGLVGQSYDGDEYGVIGNTDSYVTAGNETTTEAMGEGAIEGDAADYEMAAPFGTSFKFSRFGLTSAKPRDATLLAGKKIPKVAWKAQSTVVNEKEPPTTD
jgi:hypothetical protein